MSGWGTAPKAHPWDGIMSLMSGKTHSAALALPLRATVDGCAGCSLHEGATLQPWCSSPGCAP